MISLDLLHNVSRNLRLCVAKRLLLYHLPCACARIEHLRRVRGRRLIGHIVDHLRYVILGVSIVVHLLLDDAPLARPAVEHFLLVDGGDSAVSGLVDVAHDRRSLLLQRLLVGSQPGLGALVVHMRGAAVPLIGGLFIGCAGLGRSCVRFGWTAGWSASSRHGFVHWGRLRGGVTLVHGRLIDDLPLFGGLIELL